MERFLIVYILGNTLFHYYQGLFMGTIIAYWSKIRYSSCIALASVDDTYNSLTD
jgi:hypothetical protein